MNDFIRVLGDNPNYKGKKYYMYVRSSLICQIHPIYAVEENGTMWQSMPDQEGAKIVSYFLYDNYGNKYSCFNQKELNKLGILHNNKTESKIGYINKDDSEKIEVDIKN